MPTTLSVSDQLFINGYSQPQSLTNSFGNDERNPGWNGRPCVILDGMDSGVTGISTASGLGSESLDVRGLAFERFATAISLTNGSGNRVRGSQFGGEVGSTGMVLRGGATAIRIESAGNTVGGTGGNADDNLIGSSLNTGVLLTATANQNVISGNRIGVDKNAMGALVNGTGIRISGADNEVRSNLIARNSGSGVQIRDATAVRNVIEDNQFHNQGILGNGSSGVELSLSARDNDISGNTFIGNLSAGVRVASSALDLNRISGNTFSGNGLAIHLGAAGVSPNNPDNGLCLAGGCAANNGQNFPELVSALHSASASPSNTLITGTLRTVVSTLPYRVEYYVSPACHVLRHGEGARQIGSRSITVSTEAGSACTGAPFECTVDASLSVSGQVQPGEFISAITIANNGNTSEFSGCVEVRVPPVVASIFRNGFE